VIGIDEERSFFDDEYRRCLSLPDHALEWNAQRLRQALDDPSHPFWERRRLFATTLEVLLGLELARCTALDYGCGTGDWGVLMATEGARVTLLDLSPVAVEVAQRRARASGVEARVSTECRDASDLSCFASGHFDLVFAGASLHHTLKYPGALEELVRVIRPGGTLVLAETFGNNRLLTILRRLRARLAREPQEQGEGVVLSDHDLARLKRHFTTMESRPLNLLAMAKRFFRGHYRRWPCRALIAALEGADRVLLRAIPRLHRHCGEVVVIATK
jgi:2-polyprenyl-3-methyl-5-hydroxy-6-metoxy-1,4-benzoquinol methylase